jgi:Arc/MetJ-type ribon-helix-helix transcriptional regulator
MVQNDRLPGRYTWIIVYGQLLGSWINMASVTVGFSMPEDDRRRLDRLTSRFARGNRSAFLRLAMDHMEVLERAEKLGELRTFGVQQRTAVGLDDVDVETVVHRALAKRRRRG